MNILVTNDDGILSEGLWVLVRELDKIARVTVVAPDIERSGIGTAVTLLQPLHVEEVTPPVAGVTAYAIDGSPSDCVLLALGKLAEDNVDMVVSGINPNVNLGEDVHISGTVSAALQSYLRGFPSMAISAPPGSKVGLDTAARVAAALVQKIAATIPTKIFLNINVPDLSLQEIAGVKITRLARESHLNTVEEGNHGRQKYYWLVRQRISEATDNHTDIWAIEQGFISITPLYTNRSDKPPYHILNSLCANLLQELKSDKKQM